MTHDELVEKVAKSINGPFQPVPEGSPLTLNQLRDVRWQQISGAERKLCLASAKAAIATILAAIQEPTDEMSRCTLLTKNEVRLYWPELLAASPLGEKK